MTYCRVCKDPIQGQYVEAGSDVYHQDCFRCFHCLEAFKDNQFFDAEDGFYCEADYTLLFV
jgi:hypothetical protein